MTLLLAIVIAGGVALLWSVARRSRLQRRTSMAGDGSLDADVYHDNRRAGVLLHYMN